MATVRRLADTEVESVFNCFYGTTARTISTDSKVPPFKVVLVSYKGMKLSPPCKKFENGLYLLVRPETKTSFREALHKFVPPHLRSLVYFNHFVDQGSRENCSWNLSGPQFQSPCPYQQRYCYPKGDEEYSLKKGGALWTKVNGDSGKEFLTYRLLHIYHSSKRVTNKSNPKTKMGMNKKKKAGWKKPEFKRSASMLSSSGWRYWVTPETKFLKENTNMNATSPTMYSPPYFHGYNLPYFDESRPYIYPQYFSMPPPFPPVHASNEFSEYKTVSPPDHSRQQRQNVKIDANFKPKVQANVTSKKAIVMSAVPALSPIQTDKKKTENNPMHIRESKLVLASPFSWDEGELSPLSETRETLSPLEYDDTFFDDYQEMKWLQL